MARIPGVSFEDVSIVLHFLSAASRLVLQVSVALTLSACSVSLRSCDSAPGAEQVAAAFYGAAQTELRGVEGFQTGPNMQFWFPEIVSTYELMKGDLEIGRALTGLILQ